MGVQKLLCVIFAIGVVSATLLAPDNPRGRVNRQGNIINLGFGPVSSSGNSNGELVFINNAMRNLYGNELQNC